MNLKKKEDIMSKLTLVEEPTAGNADLSLTPPRFA
jgi:hypothetical protein